MTTAIAWRTWNDEARQQAHNEQKILMVYCGSELDHWSQRWLREIEQHQELCESINQVCIPVQIQVVEELEFSIRAQEVLAVTSESQGWPAIIWLTPNGNPIGGTPYRPLFDGEKMRGFAPMFIEVVEAWYGQREAVDADVSDMRQAWRYSDQLIAAKSSIPLKRSLDALEAHCMHQADSLEGGFGSAPREPGFSLLPFLLTRLAQKKEADSLDKHVEKSLHALIAGGIHDHVQGGFFRASTDTSWNIPFFEKRCVDQARMILLLVDAAAHYQSSMYIELALRTVEFVQHYLCLNNGTAVYGFAAESLGAGGQLINGAAYLWSYEAIESVIGKAAASIINKRYLSDQRCFIDDEFAVMAIRDELTEKEREQLPLLCQRLLGSRLERPQPKRSEYVSVYAQATLLRALLALMRVQEQHDFKPWAKQLVDYLLTAKLETSLDLAAAGLAVLEYQTATANADKALAGFPAQCAEKLQSYLRENGSLLISQDQVFADSVIAGPDTEDYDSPLALCYQLWQGLGAEYSSAAEQLLQTYLPLIKVSPMAYAGLLTAYLKTQSA